MVSKPMYRLTEAFPYLVTRVGVRMGELIARRLERYGLTLPMYRVMAALWQRGGQRLGDLSEMTTVEISTELKAMAEKNLADYGVGNVDVVLGNGAFGWEGSGQFTAPYDVIVISGSLPVLPDAFLRQLKVGGRLLCVIGERPVMEARLITRTSETGFHTRNLFETSVTPLRQAVHPSHFKF